MSTSPPFKVYNNGKFMAATQQPEDAAILIAAWGMGQIKLNHRLLLWNEGHETETACESYDVVAQVCYTRMEEYRQRLIAKNKALNANNVLKKAK